MMTPEEESWTSWLCDMEQDDCGLTNESTINMDIVGGINNNNNFLSNNNQQQEVLEEDEISAMMLFEESYVTFNNNANNNSLEDLSNNNKAPHHHIYCSSSSPSSSSYSYILSFENNNNPQEAVRVDEASGMKLKTNKIVNNGKSLANNNNTKNNSEPSKRNSGNTYDHIIAERMRREKISQQVIALSALIPGLKKLDKASVLTDAIKYVKELKEKVKVLEEENNKKKVVFVKTDEDASSDNTSSQNSCDDGNSERSTTLQLPEVEARVSEKSVLIQIHCDRNKGMLLNIIGEIHKLHLSVTNIASFIFGSSFLHVTIVAQMEDEFSMNVKELKRRLRVGLLQYM